jgi:hypothetical protein
MNKAILQYDDYQMPQGPSPDQRREASGSTISRIATQDELSRLAAAA